MTAPALLALASAGAQAETLPWILGVKDPWNSQHKIASYGKNLKPANCPPLPVKGQKLAMNDVVIAVLCHNTASRNAYLSLLSQADSYVAGYSAYLPSIEGLAASRSYTSTFHGTSVNSVTATVGRTSPTIEAGLTLYDFGQREARIDAAERALIAAGYGYDSGLQDTITTALKSYYALLNAQKEVITSQESLKVTSESFDAASLRYDLGIVALADKLQASVAKSQAELSLQQSQNSLTQAYSSLALLMGLQPDAEYDVIDTDDSALAIDPFNGKAKELMEEAKRRRIDLEAKRVSLEADKISQVAEKRANRATIKASVGMGFSDIDVGNTRTTRSQNIGVSVSVPLFNGFQDTYAERITQRSIESKEADLIQSERDIEKEVWDAWQNYETAKHSWDVSRQQLKVAQQLNDVALGRYKEGVGTIIEVLNAQTSYTSALRSYRAARNSLFTSRLDLVRAVGILNLDTMDPEKTADGHTPSPSLPVTQKTISNEPMVD